LWVLSLYFTNNKISIDSILKFHNTNLVFFVTVDLLPLFLAIYGLYISNKRFEEMTKVKKALTLQTENIKKTALFAEKIGNGDFEYEYAVNGENDVLGNSLIEMRNSLLASSKREQDYNWIVSSVSEVGELLRSNNELVLLSELIISFLTRKINAVQGAFYIVNYDNEKDVFIELVGSYAYNKKKYFKGKFYFGQGLVGQAIIEQDTVYRTEIPQDYVSISSGLLGEQKPKAILIVPLINEEKVYGAVEFAGFESFTPLQIKFIQELSDILARTISSVKINENTVRLLAEVNKSQQRTHVLLENASEVIGIYDAKGVVSYISPSVRNILGYDPEDIIGKNETDRVHEKGVETVNKMFSDLNKNPENPVTVQYTYIRPDGSRIWVESTGRNLIDNPSVNGILLNTIDITERRKGEIEQRERAKMQALSENSPDIILRFDINYNVSYINPVITKYTGIAANKFLSVHLDNLSLKPEIISKWREIIASVVAKSKSSITEMEFNHHADDKLFMKVSALPEFKKNGELESVLMILHDITDEKVAEHTIQIANRKVTDSINYALRIQNSILPQEVVIQDVFKESFVLFRPKDVVSGDFPFFYQKGSDIYFAAVDCTGHGVPGALLSVIGSLILTELVTHETLTPSVVLDKLHESVVRTLRQGQIGGENERDGMDVGLCRLNLITGEFMFSGAHRPLYIVRHDQKEDEELEQIKGDNYPIGGVQYRGRQKFTNFETTLKKGDKIFICSDGYPDQFGGEDSENLKKIGPKKIRKLLVENKDLNMLETHTKLVDYFDTWKGESKQLDDVLFLGVKFMPVQR
jgi:PAS domain S-box-containing protein